MRPAAGRPGGRICLSAELHNGGTQSAVSNPIGDFTALPFAMTFNAVMINPAIGPGSAANKQVVRVANNGVDTFTVAGLNAAGIPDGALYTAVYAVAVSAPTGTYNLEQPAPGVSIKLSNCAGDCNGDGQTTLGELTRCMNLFLGLPLCNPVNPILSCPIADASLDGSVSIGEVTQCVSRFLGGCP